MLRIAGFVSVIALVSGCVVQPAVVAPAPPPPHAVVVAPPPGVVYVAPTYPAPAVGFVWTHHPRYGWGWRHPNRGWHRGWR